MALLALVAMSAAAQLLDRFGPLVEAVDRPPEQTFSKSVTTGRHDRTIEVTIGADGSTVTYTLETSTEDEALDVIESGTFEQAPELAARVGIGKVSLAIDREAGSLDIEEPLLNPIRWTWAAPQVARAASGGVVVITAHNRLPSPDPVAILVEPPEACADAPEVSCEVDVRIAAPGYQVTATGPTGIADGDAGSALTATIRQAFRVDAGSVPPDGDFLPIELRAWMASLWGYSWTFAPWVVLLYILRRRFILRRDFEVKVPGAPDIPETSAWPRAAWATTALDQDAATQRVKSPEGRARNWQTQGDVDAATTVRIEGTRAIRIMLWAALVSCFAVTQQLLDRIEWLHGVTAAAPAALVAWAVWAHWDAKLGYSTLSVVLPVLAAAIGIGALAITAVRNPDDFVPLTAGSFLAVLGSAALVRAFAVEAVWPIARRREPSGRTAWWPVFFGGLAAAGVLTAAAITDHERASVVDNYVQFITAYVSAASFLLVLAWVILRGASTRAEQWQTHLGPRVAGIVVAGLILLPTSFNSGNSRPLPVLGAVSLALAAVILIQLGLVIVTLRLLWSIAQFPPSIVQSPPTAWTSLCWLATAVAVLFLLRADAIYLLPWSMATGLLLVVTVLIERHPDERRQHEGLCPCLGTADEERSQSIRETVNAVTRAEAGGRAEAALRRSLGSSPVKPGQQELIMRQWRKQLEEIPPRPGDQDLHRAFGYGGIPEATDRAVFATTAALAVGVPLSIPFLAQTLSGLTDLRGLETWIAVMASFLLLVRFPLYGFFFGYFMPLLRGNTGAAKASRLFVVLVASEGVALLLPFASVSEFAQTFALRALQLMMVCLVLGVATDYRSVRQAGKGYRALLDAYGVRSLTFQLSTATVGVLTAAATAAATTGLQTAAQDYVQRIVDKPAIEQVEVDEDIIAPGSDTEE